MVWVLSREATLKLKGSLVRDRGYQLRGRGFDKKSSGKSSIKRKNRLANIIPPVIAFSLFKTFFIDNFTVRVYCLFNTVFSHQFSSFILSFSHPIELTGKRRIF